MTHFLLQIAVCEFSKCCKVKLEIKARRNHFPGSIRWKAVRIMQAGARQFDVARNQNIHCSFIKIVWIIVKLSNIRKSRRSKRFITNLSIANCFLCLTPCRRILTARQRVSPLSAVHEGLCLCELHRDDFIRINCFNKSCYLGLFVTIL